MVGKKDREGILEAMSETAPSWGWRIHRVMSIVGLNFGSPEEIEWAMLRDIHRQIRTNPEALKAANEDKDWPPLKRNEP